jgi:hypothetical protein
MSVVFTYCLIMVEVFKTDVTCPNLATEVLNRIHGQFGKCKANFDLQDCDRVLRIIAPGKIASHELIEALLQMGVSAELLNDDVPGMTLEASA